MVSSLLRLLAATAALIHTSSAAATASKLPVVDLGYELQRATLYNTTGGYYNFSNIRYAAPPTGNLRFRAPVAPKKNRGTVQTGSQGRICAQAGPAWSLIASQFIPAYLAGQTEFNQSSFNLSSGSAPAIDPRTTEDCLFLDVLAPKNIFENAGKGKGAPVLVWIYGGGYTAGSKEGSGNPAGLLAASGGTKGDKIVYVALNYRLGAFGWLSGPTFQENGTANAGLYDQRFALEWVQKHISKFGGDPNRVTVFGESAGGGSIMHQITAFGGLKGAPPFQQAIPQSAAFLATPSNQVQEQAYQDFLSLLNVSTIDEARQLPFLDLYKANAQQVGAATYGQFVYGPTVDGKFAPALPGELLLHGQFAKNVKLMIGHNTDEGLLFTSPFVSNNSAFKQFVLKAAPTVRAWPSVLNYIINTLYPPVFDGSQAQNYTNQIARTAALVSESTFSCNSYYMDKAFKNETYAYLFSVPPGLHGQDVAYTFYNGPNPTEVIAPKIAVALQEYITNFAETGSPNGPGVPHFQMYGPNATVQDLNITGISEAMDPVANYRCDWWQKGLYF